ncbi:hypothetical protein IDJ75_19900 [Mucilaginibacter rigui]|uniref:Transposase n=1 Tax=Mucilaginibacter rigui TaxID=534635 RepID=A0ABR7XAE5_9SPHI|nr:hypothetical protein [Mucilaginibacter rigui]MBD1387558.1 hypothetical protein [Mucilaginibacter rigui]
MLSCCFESVKGYGKEGYNERMNFRSEYLKIVFNIVAIIDIHVIAMANQAIKGVVEKAFV